MGNVRSFLLGRLFSLIGYLIRDMSLNWHGNFIGVDSKRI